MAIASTTSHNELQYLSNNLASTNAKLLIGKHMKKIALGLAATFAASAAAAGTMVYEAPAAVEMVEPVRNGSGAWLIPLAIIAILALALAD